MDILNGKKFILIEDNTLLSDIIIRKLESLGVNVTHYSNGEDGMQAIRTIKPDLVLLDIMLPMMNGYEILRAMNDENLLPSVPVLVISNSGQPVEIQRVLELGAKDYIIKADFTPDEIFEKARAIIADNSTKQEPVQTQTPVADDAFAKNIGKGQLTEADTDPARILIVEDDPMLKNILSMKFSHHPLLYVFVSDGTQVVDYARQFNPDVIILDLMLPGMDGFDVFEQLNASADLKDIPVIVFSNKSQDSDKQRAEELGAEQYLIKATTDLKELITLMLELTKKYRAAK